MSGSSSRLADALNLKFGIMMGREYEADTLRRAVEEASTGTGSLVLISGEPGIGKTLLAREGAALARESGMAVLQGLCFESEDVIPYRPWVPIIEQACSGAPGVTQRLQESAVADVALLVPELAGTNPTLQVPHGADRVRLHDSICAALFAAADHIPLAIVLEDLHWADEPTIGLLRHLARRLSGSRLVVMATYRDTEVTPGDPVSVLIAEVLERRLGRRISLGNFDPCMTRGFIAAAIGDDEDAVPAPVSESLHGFTSGNPFFLEEVLRHMAESGKLAQGNGRWRLTPDPGVPPVLRDVIRARVSRLPDDTQEALCAAAVLGTSFDLDVLASTLANTVDGTAACLQPALQTQLVREQRETPGSFDFTHALVSAGLVETIPLSTRQKLHLAAAGGIETRRSASGIHIYAIARHLAAAGPFAPREGLARWSTAAIEAATAVHAFDVAISLFDHAYAAMEQAGCSELEIATLIYGANDALGRSHRVALAKAILPRAIAAFETAGELEKVMWLKRSLAFRYQGSSDRSGMDFEYAMQLIDEAVALIPEYDIETRITARGLLPNILFQVGECAEADRIALEMRRDGNRRQRLTGTAYHAFYTTHLGNIDEGRALFREFWYASAEKPWDPGLSATLSAIMFHVRVTNTELRAPAFASELIDLELPLCRQGSSGEANQRVWRMAIRREMGERHPASDEHWLDDSIYGLWAESHEDIWQMRFRDGQWQEAMEWFRQHIAITTRVKAIQVVVLHIAELAEMARTAGLFEEAESLLAQSIAFKTPITRVIGHAAMGLVCIETGRFDEAQEHAVAARQLMNDDDWLGLGARVELVDALAAFGRRSDDVGRERFEGAISEIQRVGHTWDEADAHYFAAAVFKQRGDTSKANEYAREALALLEGIEAPEPFIRRVIDLVPGGVLRDTGTGRRYGLSVRESEILYSLASGQSNEEIATALTVSVRTVERHVRNIYMKIGVHNRSEATRWAIEHGVG